MSNNLSTGKPYTYLALGDSYTIGEAVLLAESFPYQVTQMLRKKGMLINAPEIIARTGWTTDELQSAINNHLFLPAYDFVTLLVGVNNQYRGRSIQDYKTEFTSLLNQAIHFAGDQAGHVIVISIPDWGVTPFAAGRDQQQIASEIDDYNIINKSVTDQYFARYIDITNDSKQAATNPLLVAPDGLHPAALEYNRWSKKISDLIFSSLAQ